MFEDREYKWKSSKYFLFDISKVVIVVFDRTAICLLILAIIGIGLLGFSALLELGNPIAYKREEAIQYWFSKKYLETALVVFVPLLAIRGLSSLVVPYLDKVLGKEREKIEESERKKWSDE